LEFTGVSDLAGLGGQRHLYTAPCFKNPRSTLYRVELQLLQPERHMPLWLQQLYSEISNNSVDHIRIPGCLAYSFRCENDESDRLAAPVIRRVIFSTFSINL
jgi:hypothetical protein